MTEPCAHIRLQFAEAGVRVMNRGPIGKSGFEDTAAKVRGSTAARCCVSKRLLHAASAQAARPALRADLPRRHPGAHRARCSAARRGSCLRGLLPGSAGSGGHVQEVNDAPRSCPHGTAMSHRSAGCNDLRGAPLPGAPRTVARPSAASPHPCAACAPDAGGVYRWGCRGEPKPAACTCLAITRSQAGGSFRGCPSSSYAASCCRSCWKTAARYCIVRMRQAALSQARTTLAPVSCLWCDLAVCSLAGAHTPAPKPRPDKGAEDQHSLLGWYPTVGRRAGVLGSACGLDTAANACSGAWHDSSIAS